MKTIKLVGLVAIVLCATDSLQASFLSRMLNRSKAALAHSTLLKTSALSSTLRHNGTTMRTKNRNYQSLTALLKAPLKKRSWPQAYMRSNTNIYPPCAAQSFLKNKAMSERPDVVRADGGELWIIVALSAAFCGWIFEKVTDWFEPKNIFQAIDQNESPEAIEKIIDGYSHSLEQKDYCGSTPLIKAAEKGNRQLAILLLQKKANINAQNYAGETALMQATWLGKDDMVELLLQNNPDLTLTNRQNMTAYDCAVRQKSPYLSRLCPPTNHLEHNGTPLAAIAA